MTVCWQNEFDKEKGICSFYLSVFEETESGLWRRSDETVKEKSYSREALEKALADAGFEMIGIFGGYDFSAPAEDCQRWHIVARCKK